jgi:hypothetical protein
MIEERLIELLLTFTHHLYVSRAMGSFYEIILDLSMTFCLKNMLN